jgi:MFS family permease
MDLLDATVVNVALPSIQRTLGANPAALEWTGAAYTLAFALVLITGGRVGDRYGRRRALLWGLAGFTAASALSGLAQSPALLIAARALQGAMAAVMVPQVLSVIRVEFPDHERPRAYGLYGMVLALAGVSGPLLGGVLSQADLFGWGWRSIFLVNIPVGVLAWIGTARLLRESRARHAPRLDPVGGCCWGPSCCCSWSRWSRAASWAGRRGAWAPWWPAPRLWRCCTCTSGGSPLAAARRSSTRACSALLPWRVACWWRWPSSPAPGSSSC